LLGFDLNGGYRDHNGVEPLLGALSIKVTGNRFSEYPLLNGTGVVFTILSRQDRRRQSRTGFQAVARPAGLSLRPPQQHLSRLSG